LFKEDRQRKKDTHTIHSLCSPHCESLLPIATMEESKQKTHIHTTVQQKNIVCFGGFLTLSRH
jgi:hypothetical protein